MGAFIVKQPNGLYCRFSSIVDCPTHWNMTEEEYIDLKVKQAAEDAREEAKRTLAYHVKPFEWLSEYFRPRNMTAVEFENCLREMSEPVQKGDCM